VSHAILSLIIGCAFLLAVVMLQLFPAGPIRLAAQCGGLAGALASAVQAVYYLAIRP
jgi:hypothetical protein